MVLGHRQQACSIPHQVATSSALIQKQRLSLILEYQLALREIRNLFSALLAMFGDLVAFKNPPNLDSFWLEPWMLDGFGNLVDGLEF